MSLAVGRRFTLLSAASATLAGCAQRPIVLDRQAMAGIKRIALPTVGVVRSPDVMVINGISTQMAGFGLIGAIGSISGSIVRGNRSDSLRSMMAAQRFDPGPAFTELLAANLGQKGFTVVPLAADPKRRFLETVPASPDYDAVLDCYVLTYGFSALSDSDYSPYRATITAPVRLVGPGNAVLMQDTVRVSAGGAEPPRPPTKPPQKAADGSTLPLEPEPPPPPGPLDPGTFRSFSDVERDPAVAVDALRTVFATAAAGVVRRIT